MDIFSKRDGPRLEDVKAKKLLSDNAGTIRKLADQISNGGFSQMQADKARRQAEPKAEGLIIHDLKQRSTDHTPKPYVKISVNNRVVLVDQSTGRQMQLLGEIRGNFLSRKLALATKENGYLAPLPDSMFEALRHLEGVEITEAFTEPDLATALEALLIPHEE